MNFRDAIDLSRFNQAGIERSDGEFYLVSLEGSGTYFFKRFPGRFKLMEFTPGVDLLTSYDWEPVAPHGNQT